MALTAKQEGTRVSTPIVDIPVPRVPSTRCSERSCVYLAVDGGLCRQHARDRIAKASLTGTCAAALIIVAPTHVEDTPSPSKKSNPRCRTLAKKDGRFKLDADTVLWIRREAETQSQVSLARKYGVTRSTIWDIIHGRHWKQI